MKRIRNFYESRFCLLAAEFGKNGEEFNTNCFDQAERLARQNGFQQDLAWALVHADIRHSACKTDLFPKKFLCDAGLGGLARWLRAAGYESAWKPELDDAAVIREAERSESTLITTDTLMMERGVLRDGMQPAVCVPSSLDCYQQMAVVFRELGLVLREPLCMSCGGELRPVPKASVADRIPPRTALWLDEYFSCANCSQLFWRGTHWRRIMDELQKLSALSSTIGRERSIQTTFGDKHQTIPAPRSSGTPAQFPP